MSALIGERVRVHKNLHRGDWEVTQKGRVIAHLPELVLADVTFLVSQASRERVLQKRQRAVHAWAAGTVVDARPECGIPITYNPYRCASFTIRSDGAPIHRAEFCHFTPGDGALAHGAGPQGAAGAPTGAPP
jgi:hypothetical protein